MINQDFNTILELLQVFHNEQICIEHLEEIRWGGNVISPFDKDSKVYNCKGNKYRCKNTGRYFNAKTNTLFDNTKVKLQKWFLTIWIVTSHKKGISSCQLAKDIGVTQKTAWFMLQRIRKCFNIDDDNQMKGIVEVDEAYFGGKEANRHMKDRVKGVKEKTVVFGMVEREAKRVKSFRVNDTKAETLYPQIAHNIERGSCIITDEAKQYKRLNVNYRHGKVNHSQGKYAFDGIHTNTIEGFWSQVKRGINGIYHWASTKHIDKYLNEYGFRYNTRFCNEGERFNLFLKGLECKTTYMRLINE
ncbi:IS1595 family transposase [Pseudomonadota bacterium]